MEIKVSERRKAYLDLLELNNVYDLIDYLPKRYTDLSVERLDITKHNKKATLLVKIASEVLFKRIKTHLSKIEFEGLIDGEYYSIIVFNRDYLKNLLVENRVIKIIGKVDYYKKNITVSEIFFDYNNLIDYHYKLPSGFKDKEFNSIVSEAFKYLDFHNVNLDKLPREFMEKYKLLSKKESLKLLHFPKNMEYVKKGYRHLKYEEFLEFVLVMELSKRRFKEEHKEMGKSIDEKRVFSFINALPYKPTNSQILAFNEIKEDMKSSLNMYRLLQGDVGSGKTLVAILSCYASFISGNQSAFMAPTDILARQHYQNLKDIFKDELNVALLVSDLKNSEKKQIKEDMKSGTIDVVVGTHSLIQNDVEFASLGLAIIDEQHRFGVVQRQILKDKGEKVDLLLMSATPIPRTLAHTIYGELDISTLDEFPNGKRDVTSKLYDFEDKEKLFDELEDLLKKDNKIYIVCPLINSENKEKKSVSNVYVEYATHFANYGVGYLHGKMSNDAKNQTLNDFKDGKIKMLVSTTVIEVGIDIKDANVIVIYNANNFGLAQLHQLRGRVGRGKREGYCLLVSDLEEDIERLEYFKNTLDGFKISQYDMEKRGIGDIVGVKQSGVSDLRIANIITDYNILEAARKDAKYLLNNLNNEEFKKYLDYIESKYKENVETIA
ncbi:MAG: ATP-dependent DNA helicase RecG [Bacilli bacterium]|nr:ATP-dependent DNA helicase RecG [Bacilli bacterium]